MSNSWETLTKLSFSQYGEEEHWFMDYWLWATDGSEAYKNLEVWNFLKMKLTLCGFVFPRQKK